MLRHQHLLAMVMGFIPPENEHKVIFSEMGPAARFNRYSVLDGQGERCFERVGDENTTLPPKKWFICNFFPKNHIWSRLQREFFDLYIHLINKRKEEVFLWKGPQSLDDDCPLKDFWQLKHELTTLDVPFAKRSTITTVLTARTEPEENVGIIDFEIYREHLYNFVKLLEKESSDAPLEPYLSDPDAYFYGESSWEIDLSRRSFENWPPFDLIIDTKKITEIMVRKPSGQQLEYIFKIFSAISVLEVIFVDQRWINKYLPLLPEIQLIISSSHIKSLFLESPVKLTDLTMEVDSCLDICIKENAKLPSLTIEGKPANHQKLIIDIPKTILLLLSKDLVLNTELIGEQKTYRHPQPDRTMEGHKYDDEIYDRVITAYENAIQKSVIGTIIHEDVDVLSVLPRDDNKKIHSVRWNAFTQVKEFYFALSDYPKTTVGVDPLTYCPFVMLHGVTFHSFIDRKLPSNSKLRSLLLYSCKNVIINFQDFSALQHILLRLEDDEKAQFIYNGFSNVTRFEYKGVLTKEIGIMLANLDKYFPKLEALVLRCSRMDDEFINQTISNISIESKTLQSIDVILDNAPAQFILRNCLTLQNLHVTAKIKSLEIIKCPELDNIMLILNGSPKSLYGLEHLSKLRSFHMRRNNPTIPLDNTIEFFPFCNTDLLHNINANEVSVSQSEIVGIPQDGNVIFDSSVSNTLSPVSSTELSYKAKPAGDLSISITSNRGVVHPSQIRFQTIDEIKGDATNVSYASSENWIPVKIIPTPISENKMDATDGIAWSRVTLASAKIDKYYSMPDRGPQIDPSIGLPEVYMHDDTVDAVDFFWNTQTLHYGFKPKKADSKIMIWYSVRILPTTPGKKWLPVTEKFSLLPYSLYSALYAELQKIPHAAFLLDKAIPVKEKIKKLNDFCKSYQPLPLETKFTNTFELALAPFREGGKGRCDARSETYMLLMHFLGVRTLMARNTLHCWCYTLYSTGSSHYYVETDLGGTKFLEEKEITLSSPAFLIETKKVPAEIKTLTPAENKRKKKYTRHFQYLGRTTQVKSPTKVFKYLEQAALIILEKNQDAFSVDKIVRIYAQKKHIKYYSIHSPHELKSHLHPLQTVDNENFRQLENGPLTPFLLNQEKTLRIILVNATSGFGADDLSVYKSLMDTPPTLSFLPGKTISPDLRIIWLIKPETPACSAFITRCKTWKLSNKFFNATSVVTLPVDKPSVESKEEIKPIEIDLDIEEHWQTAIYGDPVRKTGAAFQAIAQKRSLIIYNPPKNPHFDIFLHRYKEGSFLFNGELFSVPEGISILCAQKKEEETADIVIEKESAPHCKFKKIYLHSANLQDLKQQIKATASGMLVQPGFLDTYHFAEDVFYITDSISVRQSKAVIKYVKAKYPGKKFTLLLAPGASFNGIKNDRAPWRNNHLIFSSDPDFFASQLSVPESKTAEIRKVIIPVSLHTCYEDLIALIKLNTFEEKIVLKELARGSYVILVGKLSPLLYQQLLPLLDDRPYIDCNGERRTFTGKFSSVMPLDYKRKLQVISYVMGPSVNYDDCFNTDKKTLALYQKVKVLLSLASKLSLGGNGRPGKKEYNHALYHQFIKQLSKSALQLHEDNCIKEIFSDWFASTSKDYAYLEILSKLIFGSAIKKRPCHEKLSRLDKNDIWQRINCFYGADLKFILSVDVTRIEHLSFDSAGFLIVSSDALEKLASLCETAESKSESKSYALAAAEPAKPTSSVLSKQFEDAKKLITDKTTPIIIFKSSTDSLKDRFLVEIESKSSFHYGEKNIFNWLAATSAGPVILLLKEEDFGSEGKWDFLKSLFHSQSIIYQGIPYTLTHQHKIIIDWDTGSIIPSHSIFRTYGKIVCFSKPNQAYLEEMIAVKVSDKRISKKLYEAYELVQQLNPSIIFTYKDLQSAVDRFLYLTKMPGDTVQAAVDACIAEFSGAISDPEKRAYFIQQISSKDEAFFKVCDSHLADDDFFASLPPITTERPTVLTCDSALCDDETVASVLSVDECNLFRLTDEDLYFAKKPTTTDEAILETKGEKTFSPLIVLGDPKQFCPFAGSWRHAIDSIIQTVKMIECGMEIAKRLILLEGESGLGKSTLYQALANQYGKEAIQVTAKSNSKDIHDAMISAYTAGKWLILDELNALDIESQNLLSRLIMGSYKEAVGNASFVVLASSNPSGNYKGRKKVIPELLSQAVRIFVETPHREELIQIARNEKIVFPEIFVDAFIMVSQEHLLNLRSFQKAMKHFKEIAQQVATAISSSISSPLASVSVFANKRPLTEGERVGDNKDEDFVAAGAKRLRHEH